jgi:hypothetical protein
MKRFAVVLFVSALSASVFADDSICKETGPYSHPEECAKGAHMFVEGMRTTDIAKYCDLKFSVVALPSNISGTGTFADVICIKR